MATYSDLGAPLYSVAECKIEIKRIDALIADISSKPVGVGVPGAGNANYIGRLSDLRKEREVWIGRWREAVQFEKEAEGTASSVLNGPKIRLQ